MSAVAPDRPPSGADQPARRDGALHDQRRRAHRPRPARPRRRPPHRRPSRRTGRHYVIERELTSMVELQAIVADYFAKPNAGTPSRPSRAGRRWSSVLILGALLGAVTRRPAACFATEARDDLASGRAEPA